MRTVGLTFEAKKPAKKAPAKQDETKKAEPASEPDKGQGGEPAAEAVQKAVDEAKKTADAAS